MLYINGIGVGARLSLPCFGLLIYAAPIRAPRTHVSRFKATWVDGCKFQRGHGDPSRKNPLPTHPNFIFYYCSYLYDYACL